MELELTGRKAIVTGAASGIGRATALLLTAEGATVAALDIDKAALAELEELAYDHPGRMQAVV